MIRFRKLFYNLHPYLLSSIASVLTIAQIVLAFFLHSHGFEELQSAGWICLWISGIFGILPIITFRRKGGVPKGESYTKTTILVDTGIYAIVRHPQNGTAWLLINLGIMLIAFTGTTLFSQQAAAGEHHPPGKIGGAPPQFAVDEIAEPAKTDPYGGRNCVHIDNFPGIKLMSLAV